MRTALIANPGSGGGLEPDAIAERLRRHGAGVALHVPDALDRVAADAPELLVVAGGDGTIGPAAALSARLGVPLAVVPAGTANDFARGMGLPLDPVRAIDAIFEERTAHRELDLGRLSSGRPFVNVASAGLASVAARQAAAVKRHLGPLAYKVGAVLAAAQEQPLSATVLVDRAPAFSGEAWQVIVAVSGHFGGGASLGDADPQDQRLDVAVVPAASRAALVRHAVAMRRGRLIAEDDVVHARGAEVELHLPPGAELNVDGEIVRASEPERLTIDPASWVLVVPPEGDD